jgi:folate-binding protein YgfZ
MNDTEDIGVLQSDAALVDLGGRELIVATGADRVRFLHGIVTGNVAGTPVGGGCRSVLLTTKGHVVADMWLFVRPDDLWIVVPAGQAEPTASALSRYAIMDDFAAAARPGFALSALLGPRAADRLAEAGILVGELATKPRFAHAQVGDLWLARAHELGTDGFWLGGDAAAVADANGKLVAAGVRRLAPAVAEAARIAAREPRFGQEITSDYFPMEVGLDGAIDYAKGCYLGQEPIVRIRDRGHINWRLVGLELAGEGAPEPRDAIESDVKPKAGRLTSVARLPDGRGVALALLHTSVSVGSEVRIKHGETSIPARVIGEG